MASPVPTIELVRPSRHGQAPQRGFRCQCGGRSFRVLADNRGVAWLAIMKFYGVGQPADLPDHGPMEEIEVEASDLGPSELLLHPNTNEIPTQPFNLKALAKCMGKLHE